MDDTNILLPCLIVSTMLLRSTNNFLLIPTLTKAPQPTIGKGLKILTNALESLSSEVSSPTIMFM